MRIVVGYVPTDEGRAALETAVDEAVLRSSELLVLGPAIPDDTVAAKTELAATLQRARAAGVPAQVRPTKPGEDLADVLIDTSYEDDVELVIIGVRRRSRVGKLILGSTAQRVILEAGCAVHFMKPPVRVNS